MFHITKENIDINSMKFSIILEVEMLVILSGISFPFSFDFAFWSENEIYHNLEGWKMHLSKRAGLAGSVE